VSAQLKISLYCNVNRRLYLTINHLNYVDIKYTPVRYNDCIRQGHRSRTNFPIISTDSRDRALFYWNNC